mmetsp:Transcript_39830/g.66230  ORF Transcript_39830/g.66230 Transcript_39830/m.66230 type:complete len:104 (-) Transcript_39830:3-314(-)
MHPGTQLQQLSTHQGGHSKDLHTHQLWSLDILFYSAMLHIQNSFMTIYSAGQMSAMYNNVFCEFCASHQWTMQVLAAFHRSDCAGTWCGCAVVGVYAACTPPQ